MAHLLEPPPPPARTDPPRGDRATAVQRKQKVSKSKVAAVHKWGPLIDRIAKEEGFDPNIVRGIIAAESGGKEKSGAGTKGYKGLMQAGKDASHLDAETSIRAGIRKFKTFEGSARRILKRHGVDFTGLPMRDRVALIMVTYNAGPGSLSKAMAYAAAAGDFKRWNEPQHFQRALLYYGAYSTRVGVSRLLKAQGPEATLGHLARLEGTTAAALEGRYKTAKGWKRSALRSALTSHLERDRLRLRKEKPGWTVAEFEASHPLLAWSAAVKHDNLRGWYVERVIAYAAHFAGGQLGGGGGGSAVGVAAQGAAPPDTTPPAPTGADRKPQGKQEAGEPTGTAGGGASPVEAIAQIGRYLAGVGLSVVMTIAGLVLGTSRAERAAVSALRTAGFGDTNKLTNVIFWARHPRLWGQRIGKGEKDLAREWIAIRDNVVEGAAAPAPQPADEPATPDPGTAPTPASGTGTKRVKGSAKVVKRYTLSAKEKQLLAERDASRAGKTARVKRAMQLDIEAAGSTVADWFGAVDTSATFLGVSIRHGAHADLIARLDIAAAAIKERLAVADDAAAAKRIGLYSASGLRVPKPATGGSLPSMHCYGLAVDLNYRGNPFVRSGVTNAATKRATALVLGRGSGALDRPAKTAAEQWQRLDEQSRALQRYLTLGADDKRDELAALVAELPDGGGHTVEAWQKLIRADAKRVPKQGEFRHHTDPSKGGFMDLDRVLVEELAAAGLLWGGMYKRGKDIMHFDWRGGRLKRKHKP